MINSFLFISWLEVGSSLATEGCLKTRWPGKPLAVIRSTGQVEEIDYCLLTELYEGRSVMTPLDLELIRVPLESPGVSSDLAWLDPVPTALSQRDSRQAE